jgi:NAD(P)-dependent dehydrogenase (short-subunit alcohol dehydrogenase family)
MADLAGRLYGKVALVTGAVRHPAHELGPGASWPAGTPEDIAGRIAFLASEDAGYVNDVSLDANGGVFMA